MNNFVPHSDNIEINPPCYLLTADELAQLNAAIDRQSNQAGVINVTVSIDTGRRDELIAALNEALSRE